MTRPLLWRLGTHVPGWVWGDNAEYVWKVWWTKRALIDHAVSLFYAPHIFYPTGFSLAGGELTPAQTWLALPLTVAFGPVVAYNTMAFASFVLTGFTTYLLVFWLSRDRWAALLGGVIFTFLPFRYNRFGGQLPLMATQWMPLTFLFIERTLQTRRRRDAFLSGLFFALNALSSWYYAAMVGLLLAVYMLVRTRPWRKNLVDQDLLACGLVMALTVVLLVGTLALPYLQAQSEGNLTHAMSEADQWSASITDYFVPNPLHPLWARYVVVYLVPTNELWRAFEFALSWGFGASLMLLYLFVPPFGGLRVWSRFGVMAGLMVAVLAGLGLAAWRRERIEVAACQQARLGSLFFIGLALFELMTLPFGMVKAGPRPVDEWLAAQPESFVVIQLPYDKALEGTQLYYSQYHGKPIASGYGSFFPRAFAEHEDDLRAFPADRCLDVLLGWEVRYILVNPANFSDWPDMESRLAAQPRLRLAYDDGTVRAYELMEGRP